LLAGCAAGKDPDINAAAIRLLNRQGIEVVVAEGPSCCGALTHHMGLTEDALAKAKAMIGAWTREIGEGGLDAIIVTTSGCGTTIKDYGHLFRTDPEWRDRAARIASLACDITEYLARLEPIPVARQGSEEVRVAYHSACSLQHGQGVRDQPTALLKQAGFAVLEVPEGHLCCGSAGTYNMLQPELSRRLRDRKAGNINGLGCDAVATGNIGCIRQLAPVLDAPILHVIELLDWASGGPRPQALDRR
jgi:glycolate oxidase iron-sulfur subunit